MKKVLALLRIAIVLFTIITVNIFASSSAIVNATVIGTRLDLAGDGFLGLHGKYLSLINLTDTYPHKTAIDSTRSDCPLAKGQQIQVKVVLKEGIFLYQGKLPVLANMTLYRSDGIGFSPWNGCP